MNIKTFDCSNTLGGKPTLCTNVHSSTISTWYYYLFLAAKKNHICVGAKQKIFLGLASITSLRMRVYLVCACTVVVFDMWDIDYDKDLFSYFSTWCRKMQAKYLRFFLIHIQIHPPFKKRLCGHWAQPKVLFYTPTYTNIGFFCVKQ